MENRRRVCAYCGRGEKLTREDLFATFLRSFYPSYRTYLDHRRGTQLRNTAPVVRDVCHVCNNELLSKLDGYVANLNRRYFSGTPAPDRPITFDYDYDLLLRWLLKVWYNDARASGRNVDKHRLFAPYIRGETAEPPLPVTLTLGILAPIVLRELGSSEHPRIIRFGTTSIEHAEFRDHLVLARMLTLNSYLFHLFVWESDLPRARRREFARGLEREWAFEELRQARSQIVLRISKVDTFDHLAATFASGGALRRRLTRAPR